MGTYDKVNAIAARITQLWSGGDSQQREPSRTVPTSESGKRYDSSSLLLQASDIFRLSWDYLPAVMDCKRLADGNPIFSGIMDRIVGPVAEAETYVKVDRIEDRENHPKRKLLDKELNAFVQRTQWNENKDFFLRNLLTEGGLSCEVVADRQGVVRALEYRPHYSMHPITVNGKIADPTLAFQQVDVVTNQQIAAFAKWQIAEVNWKESQFHDRGVPYFFASRKLLSSIGDMINGVVHKWMRSGGEIEVFQLKDAKDWTDVEAFQKFNRQDLSLNSKTLIRQVFGKGDITVTRLHGDQMSDDTRIVEFLLELIFLSLGLSKEALGFRGDAVIRDMASISLEGFLRLLARVQVKHHAVLKKAIDTQMLLMYKKWGVLPDQVDYALVGGTFSSSTVDTKIDTTVKVVKLLNELMGQVENKQSVLQTVVEVLTYDLRDYGLSFKESLIVKREEEPSMQEQEENVADE